MSTNGHKWDPESYIQNAEYVYKLGKPLLELLEPQENEKILDIGCGNGEFTKFIMEFGCNVIGIDTSPEMVEAAISNGVDALLMDARNMNLDTQFDALITNAAFHWMCDIDMVLKGCYEALRPGGKFVGEFGGEGNVNRIITATRQYFKEHEELGEFAVSWYFPSVEEFEFELENAGFFVEYLELIPRPTELPTGLKGWISTFFHGLMINFSETQKEHLLDEVSKLLKTELFSEETSTWYADYVRLRFKAKK